jgi:predicted amidohydrolase YtcJ
VDEVANAVEWRAKYAGSHVRAGAVKVFMDGVLEAYTGLMVEPYEAAPGNTGGSLHTAERFNEIAAAADALGLQIFVHCCGDGAVRRTLDGYEHAQRVNGRRDSRHRVEHVEQITSVDVPRFAQLGAVASMQPLHCAPTLHAGDVWPSRVGEERWPLSFAWQTLREAGAPLIWGSDWPVAPFNPMLSLWAGRNREPWAPGHPEQRQTLEQLLIGFTRDAAWGEFMEHEKGMLREGYLADVVLLDRDLFAVADAELASVGVMLTICDGKIVHRAL